VQRGDVIVEYNGRPVKDSDSLVAMVVNTKPGTTVPVSVVRDKQRKTLSITVGELDLDAEQSRTARSNDNDSEPTATGLGMDLSPITPEIARQLELPRGQGGAVVTNVDPNSPAATGGVLPGDVIVEVNRTAVANVQQVTREIQRVEPRSPVFMVVYRDGKEVFITMRKR
jgi:serine protease Do